MHGMLATFAEYYSNNLATEIKKGLTSRPTASRAPSPIRKTSIHKMLRNPY
jgi:hypothetical protein